VVYMENDIFGPSPTHDLSEEILAECTNKEALCAYWAVIGGEDSILDVILLEMAAISVPVGKQFLIPASPPPPYRATY
jgi:hypothetical protein